MERAGGKPTATGLAWPLPVPPVPTGQGRRVNPTGDLKVGLRGRSVSKSRKSIARGTPEDGCPRGEYQIDVVHSS